MSWRVLPSATQLEICGYLEIGELGRLEICGRRSVDDAARAWTIMVARIAGGHLPNLPPKKRVAAHARARALIPSTPEENDAMAGYEFTRLSDQAGLDEFSFTVAVAWGREGHYETATFPYLSLTTSDAGGELSLISDYRLLAEPFGPGHETIAPYLRDAESLMDGTDDDETERFINDWGPKAYLICTRNSDGAAIRVAAFNVPAENEDGYDRFGSSHAGTRSISFRPGRFLIAEDELSHYMTLHMIFDAGTGRVRAFCSTVFERQNNITSMSDALFCALLRARLGDSISD